MSRRSKVSGLAISAVAFVTLLIAEGFSPTSYVPTEGDVTTIGFGTTAHSDGAPVADGETVDPVSAIVAAHQHIEADERRFRDSLPGVELSQAEYDLYVDFIYQFGIGNWYSSSMRRHLLAGEYREACESLLLWRFQAGRDCSLEENWGPRGCKGVWTRQQARHARCIAAQDDQ